jgi:hypothetical protein
MLKVRFWVLTMLTVKVVFWDVAPCRANFRVCPEDGGSWFLQKVGTFLPDYKASHPRRQ